jgi:RIO kinase 1
VPVPFPVDYGEDRFDLEYLGDERGAAPQLARARLGPDQLASAWSQLCDGLADLVGAGYAHGDLSAFNLLWWDERLWFIDFPQAVDLAENPLALDFLHRDIQNVCAWFARRNEVHDPDELFAELLPRLW